MANSVADRSTFASSTRTSCRAESRRMLPLARRDLGAKGLAPQIGAPSQGGPDARDQDLGTVGLDDVVLGPELESRHDVGLLALGRRHDDRQPLARGIGLQDPQHLQAVDPRQHDVQHDAIGIGRGQGREPLLPVRRHDRRPAFLGQGEGEKLPDIGIVFYDQDRRLRHFPIRASVVELHVTSLDEEDDRLADVGHVVAQALEKARGCEEPRGALDLVRLLAHELEDLADELLVLESIESSAKEATFRAASAFWLR